jgi:hypothetical protein
MEINSLPIGISMIRAEMYVADAALEKLFPVSFRSMFIPMTAAYW